MTEPLELGESAEGSASPGRVRTWWHPLLVNLLDWALQGAYEVRDEVPVGRLPPQLDIVILRRLGELPEIARRELAPLVALLNEVTVLEFKGPTDMLGPGDLSYLLVCAFLFHGQQRPPLALGTLTTVIIAPALTGPFREDVARLGFRLHERRPGVWEVMGSPFSLWLLETDRLTASEHTALALFSRIFLRDPRPIIEQWRGTEHAVVLGFVIRQVEQFKRRGEEFAMQHTEVPAMDRTWEQLQIRIIQGMTLQEKMELLMSPEVLNQIPPEKLIENIPPEKLIENIPPEKLLQALATQQFVGSLDASEREQLRRLLDQAAPRSPNGNAGEAE